MDFDKLHSLIKDVLDREDSQESAGNDYLADVLAIAILKEMKEE